MRISDWSSDVCSSDLVQAAFELLRLALQLLQLLLALVRLLAQDAELVLQPLLTGLEQLVLGPDDLGSLLREAVRKGDLPGAGNLGVEASHLAEQAQLLDLQLAARGREARVVHPEHDLALLDQLARMDQDLLDDAALQRLDDLKLAGGDNLSFAARDLVDLRPAGPEDDDRQEGDDREQEEPQAEPRPLMQGGLDLGGDVEVAPALGGPHDANSCSAAPAVAPTPVPAARRAVASFRA